MRLDASPARLGTFLLLLAPAALAVPATPGNSSPCNGCWENNTHPYLYGTSYSSTTGVQTDAQFQLRLSTGAYGGAGSQDSGALGAVTYWSGKTALSEGPTYFWHVRYGDATGWSAYSTETSFRIDVTPPTVPTSTVAPNPTLGTYSVSWTPSSDPLSGLNYYYVQIAEAGVTPGAAPVLLLLLAGLAMATRRRTSRLDRRRASPPNTRASDPEAA